MDKNIICICGNAVDKEIQFCDSCGLGLPEIEIELKETKQETPEIDYLQLKWMKQKDIQLIKLSELF